MAANVKCVLHNGSSYRCLRCWVKQLRGCSHEAYMVEQGYRNPPICRQYSDAAKENLTPVPDSLVWGAMSVQGSDIADLPKGVDEEDDDGESVTIMLSDDGREGEEEEDNEDESDEDEEENQEDEEDEEDEDGGSPSKRKTKRPNVERLLEGIAKDLKTIIGLLKDKSGTPKEAVIVKDEDALPQSLDAYELGPHWQRRAREEQQGPIAGPSRASGGE
ncbi:hypothetical protein K466DRAFT_607712 [Polyporus arcularius HHB13444]|uniref:Uncharacterized protein n=1 Tax=Polyporus arcularius HHB13444 TaxID=1314778 RepID=A0A5C3NNB4_9APHY|nr:hypothetical protein K466DRAFT_607712 [Polyporus arcularius HHB13444]